MSASALPAAHDKQQQPQRLREPVHARFARSEHADVLEWLWLLNSHPETVYKLMYGDKDTFRLAFHLAGKAGAYQQARAHACIMHAL